MMPTWREEPSQQNGFISVLPEIVGGRPNKEDHPMRVALSAILLTTLMTSAAFAQGYEHHRWCLISGPNKECGFDTLAQCKAGKHGNADHCMRNTAPINH